MDLLKKSIGILFVCFFLSNTSVNAQQEGFLGEMKMFGGNFAPRGWAFCEGQLLSIAQNQALFAIIGTIYGGDGRTTFALPDLRGRAPIGAGRGSGLQNYMLAQRGGNELIYLNVSQLPAHNHTATLSGASGTASIEIPTYADEANESEPSAQSTLAIANYQGNEVNMFSNNTPDGTLKPFNANVSLNGGGVTINNTGSNQAVDVRQPFLAVRYIICIQGVFPSRN